MDTARYYLIHGLATDEERLARVPEMLVEFRATRAKAREIIEQSHAAIANADRVLTRS
jgi:hypothetical protein